MADEDDDPLAGKVDDPVAGWHSMAAITTPASLGVVARRMPMPPLCTALFPPTLLTAQRETVAASARAAETAAPTCVWWPGWEGKEYSFGHRYIGSEAVAND